MASEQFNRKPLWGNPVPGMVKKRSRRLSIAIPSSFAEETADRKLRAYKVGQIARAAGVFRVDEVAVYRDPRHDDSREIVALLRYAETPQYLRKHLFRQMKELQYAGVLPPLRLPHHRVEPALIEGQYREGVVLKHNGLTDAGSDVSAWVDVGATSPVPMAEPVPAGRRITVRIYSRDGVFWCTPEASPEYWGYRTTFHPTLYPLLRETPCVLVTSVQGEVATCDTLRQRLTRCRGDAIVAFGSPHHGVPALLEREGHSGSEFADAWINVVPGQGSATVRTEEAVTAALALINIIEE